MHVHSCHYHDSTPGPSRPHTMYVSWKNTGIPRMWTDQEKSRYTTNKVLLTKSRLGCRLLLSPAISIIHWFCRIFSLVWWFKELYRAWHCEEPRWIVFLEKVYFGYVLLCFWAKFKAYGMSWYIFYCSAVNEEHCTRWREWWVGQHNRVLLWHFTHEELSCTLPFGWLYPYQVEVILWVLQGDIKIMICLRFAFHQWCHSLDISNNYSLLKKSTD